MTDDDIAKALPVASQSAFFQPRPQPLLVDGIVIAMQVECPVAQLPQSDAVVHEVPPEMTEQEDGMQQR